MAVRDDWHGKGVGTALMEAALDLADNWLNHSRIELTVYTDNAAGTTKLTGNVAGGPALQVVNTKTKAGSRGLQVNVAEGKPPILVNATSGKATNLNADEVDGRNAPLLLRVAANGNLQSNDTIAKVTHTANCGYYEVEFNNRAVTGCVYQATLVNGPDGGEIAVYPSDTVADRLAVITTRNGLDFNARYDRSFHLVLYC